MKVRAAFPNLVLKNDEVKVESSLTTSDPKDSVKKGSRRKTFKIKLESGKTYQIDMKSSEVLCFLRLEVWGGKSLPDESKNFLTDAQIKFQCKQDDNYCIVATTQDSLIDESKVPLEPRPRESG